MKHSLCDRAWSKRKLSDCGQWFSGGTPSKANPAYWEGSMPWASAKDMKSFRLYDTEDHLTVAGAEMAPAIVPSGSILLLVRGMTLHNDIPICITMRDMAFNQDVKAIIPAPDVEADFLAYWLLAQKSNLLGLVDSASHGTGRLLSDVLFNLEIKLPPIPEQRLIARILGSLDNKIEANRGMNETLEAIARTLFKSWFVDFDPVRARADGRAPAGMDAGTAALFPGGFEETELGMVPRGWRIIRLSDICLTQYGYTESASDQLIGPHFLRVTDINKQNWIDWEKVPYCRISDNGFEKYRLKIGDIIVARMADPGKCAIIESNIAAVFASYLVRLKMESLSHSYYVYEFLKSSKYTDYVEGAKSGSVQANMNAKIITDINLVLPDQNVLNAFLDRILPLRMKLLTNIGESNIISEIRNDLLLKLISWEAKVKL
jgi:type I restriction enzyme S subunit